MCVCVCVCVCVCRWRQDDLARADQELLRAAQQRRAEELEKVQRSHRTEASLQEQQVRARLGTREGPGQEGRGGTGEGGRGGEKEGGVGVTGEDGLRRWLG